ncbi:MULTISPECIES: hypothetical protein [Actinoalloteichus]|uniref:Uncharacterized protein n=1 Tax=Actinoalloteichus fjordicus TaxID=1612552 RepID=A0AAC9LIB6_9PSEU|nr:MULTISPECIES: hypothetical protein [Actinoalloteichus]APU17876.1 hypothetical protein UA74_29420 [Actinoalloteichus fjordicus]APU23954.1 hypothetical protein UA75_29950 [Actinoalloteichus sp. GBA129-24]
MTALRRAHALLAEAYRATTDAETAIDEGAALFAAATIGSTQPEVEWIAHCAAASGDDVRAARALFVQAQDLIDGYCWTIAGHGIDAASSTPTATVPTIGAPVAETPPESVERRYGEWIAELLRSGTKISPERVVRMGRHFEGHLVWLETGDIDESGRAHIMRPERKGNFDDIGIPPERVVDTIFELVETRKPVGYLGRSGEVYDVEIDGCQGRLLVVIGSNGYIVTAYPIKLGRKIRPHRRK